MSNVHRDPWQRSYFDLYGTVTSKAAAIQAPCCLFHLHMAHPSWRTNTIQTEPTHSLCRLPVPKKGAQWPSDPQLL